MSLKEWEYYSFIQKDLISKEVYMLFSTFGEDNKYLQTIQKQWFESKDIEEFRDQIEEKFEEIEVKVKPQVDRDNLSCLLRMMAICDTFFEYEYLYEASRETFLNSNKEKINSLNVYDYAFDDNLTFSLRSFIEDLEEINLPKKYSTVIEDIKKSISRVSELGDYNLRVKEAYKINDLMSDLLDVLEDFEDFEDNSTEFGTIDEVILYNFAIYQSTKMHFLILLREYIILEEEKSNNIILQKSKPLINEEELRLSETKVLSDKINEIYYKTLKN
ncbi:hypothetical protein [Spiroplasma monobiae]|uniref:Uncharacterized protein n=1 Tax=Spiroplasma monobiae MQ-1 TaxID=1336748 RepID=A0A2K9LXI1_SPISQ|nr:hypothetical protein [Spiroplasma monobiae]AUM62424.1 hypothetical protein SMONO_v1c01730 [Spiroplasma monobiae MQ-1]